MDIRIFAVPHTASTSIQLVSSLILLMSPCHPGKKPARRGLVIEAEGELLKVGKKLLPHLILNVVTQPVGAVDETKDAHSVYKKTGYLVEAEPPQGAPVPPPIIPWSIRNWVR